MRRLLRAAALSLVLLGAAIATAGGLGTRAAFSATTATGPVDFSSAADWTAPTVSAAVIAGSSAGAGVRQGGAYNVYANVSDSGNPPSGVASVSANVANVTSGQTAVTLSACASGCTVGGTTYGYKSAALTSNAALAGGSQSFGVSSTDSAGNAAGATSFSVTVDNTSPTVSASVAAHANAGAARIKTSGSYFVYANASDAGGTGLAGVTANVNSITTGQTAVALAPCSASCTVNGTSYAYKSAALTAKAGLAAGSVTYSVSATDFPGNASSATNFTATVDNTAPTATNVQTANGGLQTGRPEAGDTITLTFGEQMDPASIMSGWSGPAANMVVRISNAGAAANDLVTFYDAANNTQLALGSVNLGRHGYVNTNATISFGATGTASSMVQAAGVVTITLGTPSTTANRDTNSTTMTWTSSTSATDLAGNAGTGNAATESGGADREF